MSDIVVGRRLRWKELPENLRNILRFMGAIAGTCATIEEIIIEDPDSEVLVIRAKKEGEVDRVIERAENLIRLRMDGIPALIEIGQPDLETSIVAYETYGERIGDGPKDKGGCWVKPINGSFLGMSCSAFEREVSSIEGWTARNEEKIDLGDLLASL